MIGRNIVIMVLLMCVISMVIPVSAVTPLDPVVICADKPVGYKDYTPHYQFKDEDSEPCFPPGSTIYIYTEAVGKTTEDKKTGQFKPNIGFNMVGERLPTGYTFSASASSDKRLNDDKTPIKKTYGIISHSIEKDAVEGKYRIRVTATDKNDGNKVIGVSPYFYLRIQEGTTVYPPYEFAYKDLEITPNPIDYGQTVTISVNVTNIGGKGDTKGENVTLLYGNEEIATSLHLADDETKEVEFKLSKNELSDIGTYNITIGDLNDTLVVQQVASTSDGAEASGGRGRSATPGFEVIYAISGIAIVVYMMSRRKG